MYLSYVIHLKESYYNVHMLCIVLAIISTQGTTLCYFFCILHDRLLIIGINWIYIDDQFGRDISTKKYVPHVFFF